MSIIEEYANKIINLNNLQGYHKGTFYGKKYFYIGTNPNMQITSRWIEISVSELKNVIKNYFGKIKNKCLYDDVFKMIIKKMDNNLHFAKEQKIIEYKDYIFDPDTNSLVNDNRVHIFKKVHFEHSDFYSGGIEKYFYEMFERVDGKIFVDILTCLYFELDCLKDLYFDINTIHVEGKYVMDIIDLVVHCNFRKNYLNETNYFRQILKYSKEQLENIDSYKFSFYHNELWMIPKSDVEQKIINIKISKITCDWQSPHLEQILIQNYRTIKYKLKKHVLAKLLYKTIFDKAHLK